MWSSSLHPATKHAVMKRRIAAIAGNAAQLILDLELNLERAPFFIFFTSVNLLKQPVCHEQAR